jgi:hypothetical protein
MSNESIICANPKCNKRFEAPRHHNQYQHANERRNPIGAVLQPSMPGGCSSGPTRTCPEQCSTAPGGAAGLHPLQQRRKPQNQARKTWLPVVLRKSSRTLVGQACTGIQLPDGRLTDMVNLTRAKDALRVAKEGT